MRRKLPMWEPFCLEQRGRSTDFIEVSKQMSQESLSSQCRG